MIIDITGVTSGTSPYDVFLCTWDLNNCFFVSGSVSIPPTVQIDSDNFYQNEELLQLKIIDGAGCVFTEPLPCTATPTPTPTATPTPTPSPTPTNTPIPTPEPTPTPVPCLEYSVYNLYDNMLELNFEPCCGEVNISPYGLVGQTTVTFCSTTYPTTSSPSTITLLGNCPNC